MRKEKFDLEPRLVNFAARIIGMANVGSTLEVNLQLEGRKPMVFGVKPAGNCRLPRDNLGVWGAT